MFGRSTKNTKNDQTSDRRQVQRGNTPQAFSYYASRVSDPTAARTAVRQTIENNKDSDKKSKKARVLPTVLSRLPFWILLLVVVVCTIKILSLSNDPKVIVVGDNSSGSNYLQSDAVYVVAAQKLLATSITNKSKLTVNTNGITQSLKREFPELADVSMSIPLVSNRPVVYIQPAVPSLVLQSTKDSNFAINDTGFVLSQLSSLPSGVPLVIDQSGLSPSPGRQLIPSGTVSFVKTVAYQFGAAHLTISSFVLPAGSPYELDAHLTGKPYAIRFNLENDALTQSGAAIATVQQLGGKVPSDYIDVRVPGRVYYK